MTADGRRRLRVFFKFGLLVSLPLTGYLWAANGTNSMSPLVIAMTLVSVVMALGAEGLASVAESELAQLKAQADSEVKQWNTDIAGREERIRQMDRIIETLSNQNHDLRGKLVSIHSEVHRLRDEAEQAGIAVDPALKDEKVDLPPAAEIADITSLRSRR